MGNKVNFDTSNKPFSEIIGNGKKYIIPKYQRDYSWDLEQCEDLWQDIVDIYQDPPAEREEHYMGYLVLQKQEINVFTIIDGQQRLTTLSLLILAALQTLEASNDARDQERASLIRNSYISTKNASSLTESHKLELNRNNDEYYRNDLANLSQNPRKRNIKKTEHQMRKAKEFYEAEIKKLKLNGEQLGTFIDEIISNYLLFTVILVGDEVNAYKVFETLNARGVYLSTPDLLKNYLFSVIDPSYKNQQDIEEQEEKWSIILNNLGNEDFSKFLRCFWNSRYPLTTKAKLFKRIKLTHKTPKDAHSVLEDLKQTSSVYAALKKCDDEQWADIANNNNKLAIVNCLLALEVFNIVQPYPILLSAYFGYGESDFAKICKWINAFCIRYQVICNLSSRDVEKFYNKIAIDIHKGSSIEPIKQILKSKLPANEDFKISFSTKTLPTLQSPKKARYLLASIENYLSSGNPISLKEGQYTIEHILPKKATNNDEYWRNQFGDQLEQYTSRLGNLILLGKKDNQKANRATFREKKQIYETSSLALVRRLSQYQDWNTHSLNDYQNFLATNALQIWKID